MAIYGNNTMGVTASSASWTYSEFGNFNSTQQAIFPVNGITSNLYWFGQVGSMGIQASACIYNLNATPANSPLVAQSAYQFFTSDLVTVWHAIPIVAILPAGNRYALHVIINWTAGTNTNMNGTAASGTNHINNRQDLDGVANNPIGGFTSSTVWFSIYIEYEQYTGEKFFPKAACCKQCKNGD